MSVHSWCSDPARDEAVRAAEDGRQGPLPTLGEAIAAFCADDPAKRSPKVSETSGRQSGLRTERVTLEVTQRAVSYAPVRDLNWDRMLRATPGGLFPGESVRVVEEVAIDPGWAERLAADHDAAISERDDLRKECERRLTMCEEMKRGRDSQQFLVSCLRSRVAELEEQLESVACRAATAENRVAELESSAKVAPPANADDGSNHAAPPPACGWLTANERAAIESARDHFAAPEHDDDECVFVAAALRSLLARSSPPEVVLPTVFQLSNLGDPLVALEQVKAALAAAGVTCKEVGRE